MDYEINPKVPKLTPRQIAVLELLAKGYGKRQIAQQLLIGERTVDRIIATIAESFTDIDDGLHDKKRVGTLGRAARIMAIYTELYSPHTQDNDYLPDIDSSASPLLRLAVRSELDITTDQITNDTQVSIQCLHDLVTHTAHGIIIDDRNPKANVSAQSLEVWSHSPRVRVNHKVIVEDEKRPLFQVIFDPSLTRGQRLVYHYRTVTANYFPMTLEELNYRIEARQYPLDEEDCEKSYSINSPTGHLYLRMIFPPLFELEDEHVVVEVGRGGLRDPSEETRIQKASAFEKTVFARRTSLTLDLDKPVLLRRYRIRWRPCF